MKTSKINNESMEIDKIKYILNRYTIRTEKDFSDKYSYAEEFDDTMAQSTAHRKFKHYGIIKDAEKKRYVYVGKKLREPTTKLDELCNLLNCYCDGIVSKDDEKMEMWISVDAETERIIAAKMTDYFFSKIPRLTVTNKTKETKDTSLSKRICILVGYSCLFIKNVSSESTYKEIIDLIEENNKQL